MQALGCFNAVREAFRLDVAASKPGNVSLDQDAHGMSSRDFLLSAQVSAPLLCSPSLSCGARILAAAQATHQAVQCNTNLGMLLLFAPIVCAAEQSLDGKASTIHLALHDVLSGLTGQDTEDIFAAIRFMAPGGLGHPVAHDVHCRPDCGILQAMQAASHRDLIARQYVSGFHDLLTLGLATARELRCRGYNKEWTTIGVYLRFLSRHVDSHIRRKHGMAKAAAIRNSCRPLEQWLLQTAPPPKSLKKALQTLGKQWRNAGLNPGTSADLAAASMLLYLLLDEQPKSGKSRSDTGRGTRSGTTQLATPENAA